jgi:hypothetical protein
MQFCRDQLEKKSPLGRGSLPCSLNKRGAAKKLGLRHFATRHAQGQGQAAQNGLRNKRLATSRASQGKKGYSIGNGRPPSVVELFGTA